VVGTVILFGFLILALSLYQVQVVPQENAQVEFQHFEDVRNDLVELRAGISTAGQANTPQFETVQLGTNYPNRLFAINPPSPSGTLQTSPEYNVTISNATTTVTVPTRFLQYRPGYNELGRSSTWYDASVLYLDERSDGGGFAVIEDQNLVDNQTVRITALQNEFQRSGTGSVNVELYPTESVSAGDFPTGDLNVTIPTRLNGAEYWDDELAGNEVYDGVGTDEYDDGVHALNLETNSTDVRINTVGIQSTPNEGSTRRNVGSRIDGRDDPDPPSTTDDISIRVDDLTDRRSNAPEFYVSYDVDVAFDDIDISAESTESGAGDITSSTDGRGGVSLTPGYGNGQRFAVNVQALSGGDVVAERTIYTDADTQNPPANDDLSQPTSATLDSSDITDRSQTNQNRVRYRFTYDVSPSGSFSEVQLHVLNRQGDGASGSTTSGPRSRNNVDVNPGDGVNTFYKLAILAVDDTGAVVDEQIVEDPADGNDPMTPGPV
jgi:hypothetical protein